MSSCLPAGAAETTWNPVKDATLNGKPMEDLTIDGRPYEVFQHGVRPQWGYHAPQQDMFVLIHPKHERKNAPLYVVLHSAGHDVIQCVKHTRNIGDHDIYRSPDDFYALYLDCRRNQGDWWWGGMHLNDANLTRKNSGGDPTPVERRVMDTVRWVIEKYGIDPDRVYLCGISMGGSGTLGIGMRNGDVFAAIKASIPAGIEHVSQRMYFPPQAVPENVTIPDPPIAIDDSAQNDGWSTGHERFVKAMNDRKYAIIFYWGPFGHADNHLLIEKVNDLAGSFDWLNVKRNEAYPVFTNAAGNNKLPWPDGLKIAAAGQVNAFFRWKCLSDTKDRLEMSLFLVSPAQVKTAFEIPKEATADVSLRRIQSGPVAPGETFQWTFGREKGEGQADAGGVITVPGLKITARPTMLTVARQPLTAQANCVAEVILRSEKSYLNPFMEVTLDARVTAPDGRQIKVPAFWAGGNEWRFRYVSGTVGTHTYRTECSDSANPRLQGVEGKIEIVPSTSDNALYRHGPVRVAKDGRHFQHADGTPFLWLGDTWWKGLCKRLTWEGFQELTADRKAKGFNVVQVVCGPYPDEGFFEPRWENEGGKPYLTRDFTTVNPVYFDFADRRLKHLVDAGIVPAVVGAWGRSDCNSMQAIGVAGLKRHWRHLVARYGAYPVVWIVAGEIDPSAKCGRGPWGEVATYLRSIDLYHHPVTCHPNNGQGRQGVSGGEVVIDYDMVGGSHAEPLTRGTLSWFTDAYAKAPAMPVLCGETGYEGHMQNHFQDMQRHVFWMYMLNGAAGHTYGAAGVWHASVEGDPGITPVYDWTTWKEGMNYPGSTQLGLGRKLLEQYPWWRFEPHPEWVQEGCFAAGIPGEIRVIYMPRGKIYNWVGPVVKNLEPDVDWHVYYFDPATGRKFDQGVIKATAKAGDKDTKLVSFEKNVPSPQDWILVLERVKPQEKLR